MESDNYASDRLCGKCYEDVGKLAITEFGGTFDFASATFGTIETF